ncbi:hypothetical protein MBLNU230_g6429t1 [Neophaeotheca triangularis]
MTAGIEQMKKKHAEKLHEEHFEMEEMAASVKTKSEESAAFENEAKQLKQTIKDLTAGIERTKQEHVEKLR